MAEETIHERRLLNASPKRVFELWTKPEFIKKWFGGFETQVEEVKFDLRQGGKYSIRVRTAQGPSTISGEFLQVEAPTRLVYTWKLESGQGTFPATTVEVDFNAQGDATEVVLSHGPFAQPDIKVLHSDGWQACFEGLQTILQSTN